MNKKSVAIYHVVYETETFNDAANTLLELIRKAEKDFPGADRYLFLDIEGHKNNEGGFDSDMYELQKEYVMGFLSQYLRKIAMPLISFEITGREQSNNIPEELFIIDNVQSQYTPNAVLYPSLPLDNLPNSEGCYILQHKLTRRVKIGRSSNIKTRVKSQVRLQIPFDEDVVCIGYVLCEQGYSSILETNLHNRFSETRLGRTEWFKLNTKFNEFIKELHEKGGINEKAI